MESWTNRKRGWSNKCSTSYYLHLSSANAPNSSYDAFYLLAYATYALREEPVTGARLAEAMKRLLPPGHRVEVGVAGIFHAFSALRRGELIDLVEATGSLDFDPATGEAPFDQAVLCITVDDHGVANDSVESGLVYNSAENKLVGTKKCGDAHLWRGRGSENSSRRVTNVRREMPNSVRLIVKCRHQGAACSWQQ